MPWNKMYWDIVDQFYWTPGFVGLTSIPQRLWTREGEFVKVPAANVNPDGPLYARTRKIQAHIDHLHTQEEILNHVFDLTFAIAPDLVIRQLFADPLSISDDTSFVSLGREVRLRYGWGYHDNVTQHDGLFVSNRSAIAVELKLGAKTSADQIAKYAAVLLWEELHSGRKENLGLLFIVPERSKASIWAQCGLTTSKVDTQFLSRLTKVLPAAVRKAIDANPDAYLSVLDRMRLAAVSWHELAHACEKISENLDLLRPGDQTLQRLLAGFTAQVQVHRGTGLQPSDTE